MLDHPRLVNQLVSLERRTARGGRDSIDHAPGAHDDIANVVAGVSAMFAKQSNYDMLAWFDDEPSDLLRQEQLRYEGRDCRALRLHTANEQKRSVGILPKDVLQPA